MSCSRELFNSGLRMSVCLTKKVSFFLYKKKSTTHSDNLYCQTSTDPSFLIEIGTPIFLDKKSSDLFINVAGSSFNGRLVFSFIIFGAKWS